MATETREEMVAFLRSHFRYSTMNSWNKASSYATNIKLHRLGLTKEQEEACAELLDVDGCHEEAGFNAVLDAFAAKHKQRWQIGANGRSGGYLVLYQGRQKPSEYKMRCAACHHKNYGADTKVCGYCHAEKMVPFPFQGYDRVTYSVRSVDQDEDFDSWDDYQLEARYEIVREFDEACKDAVAEFVSFAMDHKVVEETAMVPRKVKVAVEREDT